MTGILSLIMQTNHKEHICFCDKPSIKRSKFNYTETKFGKYQGYLCTIKDYSSETNELNQVCIGKNKLNTTYYIHKFRSKLILHCKTVSNLV